MIEHVDGTAQCELGPGCEADPDAHDAGMLCPGPEDGCAHCRSVFRRCDAPVIEHGPGDGTGPLVCVLGHDADDLDATEDTDRAGQRVYHPGHDTYPCTIPNCPRCTGAPSGPGLVSAPRPSVSPGAGPAHGRRAGDHCRVPPY